MASVLSRLIIVSRFTKKLAAPLSGVCSCSSFSPLGLAGQLRGFGREAEAAGGEDEGGAGEAAGGHGGAVELHGGGLAGQLR